MSYSLPSSPLLSSIEAGTHIMLQQRPHLAFHQAQLAYPLLSSRPSLACPFQKPNVTSCQYARCHIVLRLIRTSGLVLRRLLRIRRHPIRILLFLNWASRTPYLDSILGGLEQPEPS